jgi:hypothetical protein
MEKLTDVEFLNVSVSVLARLYFFTNIGLQVNISSASAKITVTSTKRGMVILSR